MMAHSTQNGRFDYENLKKKFDRKSNSRVISAQGSKFARTLPGSRINFWSNFLHESIEEVNMLGVFSRQGSSTFGWPAGSLIVKPKKIQSETHLPRHHNSFSKNLRRRFFHGATLDRTSRSTEGARTLSQKSPGHIDLLYRFMQEKLNKSWF